MAATAADLLTPPRVTCGGSIVAWSDELQQAPLRRQLWGRAIALFRGRV